MLSHVAEAKCFSPRHPILTLGHFRQRETGCRPIWGVSPRALICAISTPSKTRPSPDGTVLALAPCYEVPTSVLPPLALDQGLRLREKVQWLEPEP